MYYRTKPLVPAPKSLQSKNRIRDNRLMQIGIMGLIEMGINLSMLDEMIGRVRIGHISNREGKASRGTKKEVTRSK